MTLYERLVPLTVMLSAFTDVTPAIIRSRKKMVEVAVKKDVRYMGYILNEKQYKTYLLLLNTTLRNRGLK